MRIIAKLLLLSLEEDEEVVLNAVMSALGSFENKTQLKEEIGCEKLAFEGMEIDASKRLVYRGEKEVNITFSPPFQTEEELRAILQTLYKKADIHVDGSMVYFCCEK